MHKMKNEIEELLLVSTVYGVPNLVKSKRLLNKLFWLCFLLVSAVICCYYIHIGIIAYLEYDVITIVKTEYDQPAEFPTITFCSRIPGRLDNLKDINLYFSSVRFGYQEMSLGDLETFVSLSLGRCFRFNSGKNMSNHSIPIMYSTIGGRDDGFYLRMSSKITLILWLHNKTLPPMIENFNNHDNPIHVSNGTKSNIEIAKTINSKIGMPYYPCLKNVKSFNENKTLIDYIKGLNQTYIQKNCLELCFELNYIENKPCNCSNASLGRVWLVCFKENENENPAGCTYNYKSNFYKKTLTKECSKYCPLECDSVSYAMTSNNYLTYDNLTTAAFYYSTLQYTLITQQPKMLSFDLISNIGGTLGLFVGISFLSLFELTEILLEIFFSLFKRLRGNKISAQQQTNPDQLYRNLSLKLEAFELQINELSNQMNEKKLSNLEKKI